MKTDIVYEIYYKIQIQIDRTWPSSKQAVGYSGHTLPL
jgi:hypothetical protein